MNDPHVVALFYNIEHSASVVYREAEPREYEAAKLGQSRAGAHQSGDLSIPRNRLNALKAARRGDL